MLVPFVSIEGLAQQAYEQEPPGVDRESFLLGFAAGAQATARRLLEAQADSRR